MAALSSSLLSCDNQYFDGLSTCIPVTSLLGLLLSEGGHMVCNTVGTGHLYASNSSVLAVIGHEISAFSDQVTCVQVTAQCSQ